MPQGRRNIKMKVVLLADVRGQGKKDQVIDVSEGYARNFLFPKKLAMVADNKVMNEIKGKEEKRLRQIELEKAAALETKAKLESVQVVIKVAAGEGNRLYGAVTAKDVADALLAQYGIEVDKRKISMDAIKAFGNYTPEIKLFPEITGKINVIVTNSGK